MSTMMITGASGFVGRVLLERLLARHDDVIVAGRKESLSRVPEGVRHCEFDLANTGNIGSKDIYGARVLFHLAARVHVMRPTSDGGALFHRMNADATERLARVAAEAGVRRFVYVSSIKVNGERTTGQPFHPDDEPAPEDAYGRSKRDAEIALRRISKETGLEVVIVRPPLVYGPGVSANFRRLMWLADGGLPLPLGAITNQRSLVSVWNLVDLLVHAADYSASAGGTYLVSDGEDVSTPDLLRLLAQCMDRRIHLFNVPVRLLLAVGRLSGMIREVSRLAESLQVDIGGTAMQLGWRPVMSLQDGLKRTVNAYREMPGGG